LLLLDKLLKETYDSLDVFKKEMKSVNSDSNRFCNIIEEFSNFKTLNSKQKCKMLNIYNVNKTFQEIKKFNKEFLTKNDRMIDTNSFMKKVDNLSKNTVIYRNKLISFHTLIQNKLTKQLDKEFKIKFFNSKRLK